MSLTTDTSSISLAALLVALVSGASESSLKVQTGSPVTFDGANGVDTLAAIANKFGHKELTGASPTETKQVTEWLATVTEAIKSSPSGVPDKAFVDKLNAHFLNHSFLAPSSFQPTIVDYLTWAAVRESLASVDVATHSSVLRWARYIAASIPRNAATAAWVKVPLASNELPPALQSRIVELDLAAAALADSKLRSAVPVAAATSAAKPTNVTAAAPAAAAEGKKKEEKAAPAAAAAGGDKKADKKAEKADKKAAKPAAAAASAAAGGDVPQVYRVDFRVGRILSVENHPTEARLFVEQIDVGEEKPRTVVSGLAEYYKADELAHKLVVVIVNLKAGDIKGVVSNGRVMVATGADGKKEIVNPPEGAKVGERITFASVPQDKVPDAEVAAKRFHEILKGLHTNANKIAQYQDGDFNTSAGPCTVPTIADGTVA